MLPAETQRTLDQHGIKYVLAQFVDIHGSAKTKSVPVSGLKMVAEEGAGFAGFAICGMGMEPHGPDFMARGDLSTLIPVPWQPGYGRVVCRPRKRPTLALRQPLRVAAAGAAPGRQRLDPEHRP